MASKLSVENRYRLLLILISVSLFIPFNGLVHLFDWDEINFAESAREMIVSGNYHTVSINFVPFWEKPPLFIWLQVLSMKVFGINEFAARFPDAVCGVLSLLLLFETGRKLRTPKFGLLWALAFGGSVLPFLYFKSGIIDPWFNLFIFSSLYFAFNYFQSISGQSPKRLNLILSAFLLGLGVLTKGPVAVLLFGLTFLIFLIAERKLKLVKWKDLLTFGVIVVLTGGAYHLYQILTGDWKLVYQFIVYQLKLANTEDSGHGGSIFYHPVVLFIGVFPTSILALGAFFRRSQDNNPFRKLMIILFLVVLIIFSLVRTKIVHYSSLCYFPLSYLAALTVFKIASGEQNMNRLSKILLSFVGIIFAAAPGILQYLATAASPETVAKFIKDDFAIDCLRTVVSWSGYEFLSGVAFAVVLAVAIFYLRGLKQMLVIYGNTALYTLVLLIILVPRIEKYSQGPAIAFISSFKGNPAWVSTLGYKSYAPYFYSAKPSRACAADADEQEFLLHGDTTREVYFVVKSTASNSILKQYPNLKFVAKNGGFVLLKRTGNGNDPH
jgi:hypothetical protein